MFITLFQYFGIHFKKKRIHGYLLYSMIITVKQKYCIGFANPLYKREKKQWIWGIHP